MHKCYPLESKHAPLGPKTQTKLFHVNGVTLYLYKTDRNILLGYREGVSNRRIYITDYEEIQRLIEDQLLTPIS